MSHLRVNRCVLKSAHMEEVEVGMMVNSRMIAECDEESSRMVRREYKGVRRFTCHR